MNKIFFAIGVGVMCVLVGCTSPRMVYSSADNEKAMERTKADIALQGYKQKRRETSMSCTTESVKEFEHLKDVLQMDKNQDKVSVLKKSQTYFFMDSLGNELSFKTEMIVEGSYYLTMSLSGCYTSDTNDYERLCGSSSALMREIGELKPKLKASVINK